MIAFTSETFATPVDRERATAAGYRPNRLPNKRCFRHYWVYVARDARGEALYVGHTTNLAARLRAHHRSSSWWVLANSIELYPALNYTVAAKGEWALIKSLQPRANLVGVRDAEIAARGWATRRANAARRQERKAAA